MREDVAIEATLESLKGISQSRFYRTERGYQGAFYCALREALESRGLNDDLILEIEYQKSRVHAFAVKLNGETPVIRHAFFREGSIVVELLVLEVTRR